MSRDIAAGKAFVELYIKNAALLSGLATSRRSLLKFAADVSTALNPARLLGQFGEAVAAMGKKITLAGVSVATAFVPAVKAASDAEETANKFRAVFGGEAAGMGTWIDDLANRVRRSETDLQNGASAYQAFFRGLEFGEGKAANMSKEITALAIDMGSFHNTSDQEMGTRMLAFLSGSSEVMDQFGVNSRKTALEAELMALGINKSWDDVAEHEKVLARIGILRKALQAQGAIGDAERTRDSFANLSKGIMGAMRDAAAAVGKALMPALIPVAKKVLELVEAFKEWAAENRRVIANVGAAAVKLIAFGAGLFAAGKALALMGVGLGAVMTVSKVLFVLTVIVPAVYKLVVALKLAGVMFSVAGFAAGGFKAALMMLLPAIVKTTLALGAIGLGLAALGTAYANAKLQGITFGESVLQLTAQLTGLENAYSRLEARMGREKKATSPVAALEDALKRGDRGAAQKALADLEDQRVAAHNRLSDLQAKSKKPNWKRAFFGGDSDARETEAAKYELANLERLMARFKGKLDEMAQKPPDWSGAFQNLGQAFSQAGKSAAQTFWDAYKASLPAQDELERLKAEAIVDDQAREKKLLNLEYDVKTRDAKFEGKPAGLIEQQRKQALDNLDARYARQEFDRQKEEEQKKTDFAKDTEFATKQAEIEATKKGPEREMALLKLRQEKELADAFSQGMDPFALTGKHKFEQQALSFQQQKSDKHVLGTFSGHALGQLAGGGNPAEQTARHTKEIAKEQKKANLLSEKIAKLIEENGGIRFA